jgi:TPR repeat protein
MRIRSAILSGFVTGSAVLAGLAFLLALMAGGDAFAKHKRNNKPSDDTSYEFVPMAGQGDPAVAPSSPPRQTPPQAAKQSQQPAESILDYYDGLRAWDLDEPAIATGIWLEASTHGDRRAMRRLAQLYEDGNFLPKDDALAFFWFAVADRLGDKTAGQGAERVSKRLSASSLTTLKSSVADWKPAGAASSPAQDGSYRYQDDGSDR